MGHAKKERVSFASGGACTGTLINSRMARNGDLKGGRVNPQIDTLSIAGAQSQLVIGAPYTLEVLLGTTLSDGKLTMARETLQRPALQARAS